MAMVHCSLLNTVKVEASVKESVKTEIATWSEIVLKNIKSASATQSVKSCNMLQYVTMFEATTLSSMGLKRKTRNMYEVEEYDAVPENVKQLYNEIHVETLDLRFSQLLDLVL